MYDKSGAHDRLTRVAVLYNHTDARYCSDCNFRYGTLYWFLTEYEPRLIERRVLIKIFGPKAGEVSEG